MPASPEESIAYFKSISEDVGLAYQSPINLDSAPMSLPPRLGGERMRGTAKRGSEGAGPDGRPQPPRSESARAARVDVVTAAALGCSQTAGWRR